MLDTLNQKGILNNLVYITQDTNYLQYAKKYNKLICIGQNYKNRLDGGGFELGQLFAEDSKEDFIECLKDCKTIICITSLGASVGSGVTPYIIDLAKERNIKTIVIATNPFNFEGEKRVSCAKKSKEVLIKNTDLLFIYPLDDEIFTAKNKTILEAFYLANENVSKLCNKIIKLFYDNKKEDIDIDKLKFYIKNKIDSNISNNSIICNNAFFKKL